MQNTAGVINDKMASLFDTYHVDGTQVLLREAVGTFLEVANYAHRKEVNPDVKIFYSHLSYHCCRFLGHLRQAEESSTRLNENLLEEAASLLGSLIPEVGPSKFGFNLGTPKTRLRMLSISWKEAQRQSPQARLDFVTIWLRYDISTEQRQEVDRALEVLADSLEKQQPKQPIRKSMHNISSPDTKRPTLAVSKAAKSIYNALVACKGCSCQSQHEFRAKFQLGTYCATEKKIQKKPERRVARMSNRIADVSDCLEISMFLSMERGWHEFRVLGVKDDVVTTTSELFSLRSGSKMKQRKHVEVDKLCKPISEIRARTIQLLVLHLTGGQLYQVGSEKSNIDKTAEPISLIQCFEERRDFFMEKTKRILFVIIAYTVLHLHGTSWLQPGWGSSTIKFFQTTSNTIPLSPFIETRLPNAGAADVADDDTIYDSDAGHRCLDLVALAVVLMEINFVKPFSHLAAVSGVQLEETRSGRITLADVDLVLEEGAEGGQEAWRSQIPEDSPLLDAIDNCLSPLLWNDEGEQLDETTLNSRIYENVVRPLEEHLTTSFGIDVESLDQYARNLDFAKWSQCIITQRPPDRNPSPDLPSPNVSMQRWFSALTSMITTSMPRLDLSSNCDDQQSVSQFFDDQTNDGPMFARQYAPLHKPRTWHELTA